MRLISDLSGLEVVMPTNAQRAQVQHERHAQTAKHSTPRNGTTKEIIAVPTDSILSAHGIEYAYPVQRFRTHHEEVSSHKAQTQYWACELSSKERGKEKAKTKKYDSSDDHQGGKQNNLPDRIMFMNRR